MDSSIRDNNIFFIMDSSIGDNKVFFVRGSNIFYIRGNVAFFIRDNTIFFIRGNRVFFIRDNFVIRDNIGIRDIFSDRTGIFFSDSILNINFYNRGNNFSNNNIQGSIFNSSNIVFHKSNNFICSLLISNFFDWGSIFN